MLYDITLQSKKYNKTNEYNIKRSRLTDTEKSKQYFPWGCRGVGVLLTSGCKTDSRMYYPTGEHS